MKLLPGNFSSPTRLTIGIMMFTACMQSYMLRVNMSINILDMVQQDKSSLKSSLSQCTTEIEKNSTELDEGIKAERLQLDNVTTDKKYEWSSQVQGIILGAYFWGYTITSLPGGPAAERWGPRKVVGIATVLSAVFTILSPLAANIHHGALSACRFFIGAFAGVMYPALHCLLANWAPPEEKGKFVAALMGGTFGTVITWSICGLLISYLGWQWAFYIPGIISLLWTVLWYFLVSDTPQDHPNISEKEKNYIINSIGGSVDKEKPLVPVKQLLMSVPFWAFTLLHYGNLWGLYFLLTAGPKYIAQVLGFNLSKAGFISGLPYITRMLMGFVFGIVGDAIRKRNIISITAMRKIFCIFSHFLPGIFLVGLSYVGCDPTVSVAIITTSLGINGAASVTNLQNHQDLAPNYAGTLYGIANCIGSTAGFVTPLVTSYFTREGNGIEEWRNIFITGAAAYFITGAFFLIFGSGQTQPWNKKKTDNESLHKDQNTESYKQSVDNLAFETENKTS